MKCLYQNFVQLKYRFLINKAISKNISILTYLKMNDKKSIIIYSLKL